MMEPSVDSTEAKTNLRFFAVALGTGIAVSLLAAALEESHYLVSTVLVFAVGFVSLMILGMAVSIAREPSLPRLTLVGFVTLIAPWFSLLLLSSVQMSLGHVSLGHDAGGFSLIYYMWGCTIAGLGLLVTALCDSYASAASEAPLPHETSRDVLVRIDVEKSAYHQQSQSETSQAD
jgi:hypothetical protein